MYRSSKLNEEKVNILKSASSSEDLSIVNNASIINYLPPMLMLEHVSCMMNMYKLMLTQNWLMLIVDGFVVACNAGHDTRDGDQQDRTVGDRERREECGDTTVRRQHDGYCNRHWHQTGGTTTGLFDREAHGRRRAHRRHHTIDRHSRQIIALTPSSTAAAATTTTTAAS